MLISCERRILCALIVQVIPILKTVVAVIFFIADYAHFYVLVTLLGY